MQPRLSWPEPLLSHTSQMYFGDLSHDTCLGRCPHVSSVAWLGAGHAFTTGTPPADLVPLLRQHLINHWSIFAAAGTHSCEFCMDEGRVHKDSRNLFIPSAETIYLVPGMIIHYIEQHGYVPPQAFIEALRVCPPQGSGEFMALLKNFHVWWNTHTESRNASPV